jgi:hypothetical protein
MAFAIAVRDELPCAITATPRSPSRYAPPAIGNSAASSRKRRARRTGLSSSSPRKPPRLKSLSTTRWMVREISARRDQALPCLVADPVAAKLHHRQPR